MSDLKIERRQLLQLASASLLASQLRLSGQTCNNANYQSLKEAKPYSAQFFTPEELTLLDEAMEAILPADDHSPGAHEAQVALYADLIVSNSPDDVKQDWRAGLTLLAAELKTSSLAQWLDSASANEHDPRSPLDIFFIKLKQTTVEGYYTSRIGIHQELRYIGNTYVKEFKGCSHEEHRA
ncbi:MAG TPA: gluconate 2-dehydrogenase subunit 3 family protein [Bryobacteraceae bacterium]|nr:gluconate 2-dehydrogenase subunit 3 family protein [Bryobacteraceae bacterium]